MSREMTARFVYDTGTVEVQPLTQWMHKHIIYEVRQGTQEYARVFIFGHRHELELVGWEQVPVYRIAKIYEPDPVVRNVRS